MDETTERTIKEQFPYPIASSYKIALATDNPSIKLEKILSFTQ